MPMFKYLSHKFEINCTFNNIKRKRKNYFKQYIRTQCYKQIVYKFGKNIFQRYLFTKNKL